MNKQIISLGVILAVISSGSIAVAAELDADDVCSGSIVQGQGESSGPTVSSALKRAEKIALKDAREECDGKRVKIVASSVELEREVDPQSNKTSISASIDGQFCCNGKVALPAS